ncbi:thiosulfohydrolase SoxB [Methyloraptor flagellatus]|uniref:Thiosulfohydrolase SoxB n=1 Tax=Methyloraptor flagellatus TaxID=3162530 RepID=A0AAU7X7P9_9HYPH
MNRRHFLQLLAAAGAAGMSLPDDIARAEQAADRLYEVPAFGNVSVIHITDTHAQLKPLLFREPSVNLGVGSMRGQVPHLVGGAFLERFGIAADTPEAHAFTYLDFERKAGIYGRAGGYAHIATLVKRLRASRPGALLLDGGDSWQGSGTALWTKAQDMVDASKLLGIDFMTLHWEATYGQERVKAVADGDFAGKIEILAQNLKTADFGDPVFASYAMREMGGVKVAIIGQAFPYLPIANPRYMIPDWTLGIQEEAMQKTVDEARAAGARAVIVLSHNGMDVDLKLASRVTGIDAILGGHTHDATPKPVIVASGAGKTLVVSGGSNGKFVGVLDLDVRDGKVADFRYKLLPVFANLLPADPEMAALIAKVRAPYEAKLAEKLAVSEGLLYRRGNFTGSFDKVILDALIAEKDAEIAFSPGFRWGTTVLPGEAITMENLLDQTAITYPAVTVNPMTGEQIKGVLEDVCDNLFNVDPYHQQGGDMVRVGGMTYSCDPSAAMGSRISDMRIGDKPVEASKTYKVAGWASVSEAARDAGGEPVFDLVARWLKNQKVVKTPIPAVPRLRNVDGNPGAVL